MKSLNIDVIFPWEVGLVLVITGLIFIIIGVRQSKKEIDDFDKIPLTKPTTKILLGSFLCLFGAIQMLSLLSNF
ncbi:hypothetical protein OAQ98_00715 [Alphaproteobacteria bacterium]|nr:hypothetical protein [Alphaproteobacteria bacterium]